MVFFPSEMVTYKLTFMMNGTGMGRVFLIAFLLLFILEVVVISLYFKKHMDKPLKKLMQGMDEVSEGKRDIVLDYNTDKEELIARLMELCINKLPEYCQPSAIAIEDELPLTPIGKIDYRKLSSEGVELMKSGISLT